MKLDGAVALIMSAVRSVNVFLQEQAPWAAAKEGRQADVEATLYVAADALQRCAALLHPIMPEKMVQLRAALGVNEVQPELEKIRSFGELKSGVEVLQPDALFPASGVEDGGKSKFQ